MCSEGDEMRCVCVRRIMKAFVRNQAEPTNDPLIISRLSVKKLQDEMRHGVFESVMVVAG